MNESFRENLPINKVESTENLIDWEQARLKTETLNTTLDAYYVELCDKWEALTPEERNETNSKYFELTNRTAEYFKGSLIEINWEPNEGNIPDTVIEDLDGFISEAESLLQEMKEVVSAPESHINSVEEEVKSDEIRYFKPIFDIQSESIANPEHPERNEDTIKQIPTKGLFMVADGVGGEKAGDIASQILVAHINEAAKNIPAEISYTEAETFIKEIIEDANQEVIKEAQNNDEYKGMGATVTVAFEWYGQEGERKIIVGSVGDSRAHLYRDGKLEQITSDDNMLGVNLYRVVEDISKVNILKGLAQDCESFDMFVDRIKTEGGFEDILSEKITELEIAYNNPGKENLSQLVGREGLEVNIKTIDLEIGDQILLSSDGVTDNLHDDEIANHLAENKGRNDVVSSLLKKAQESNRKPDDISAILIKPDNAQEQAGDEVVSSELIEEIQKIVQEDLSENITESDAGIKVTVPLNFGFFTSHKKNEEFVRAIVSSGESYNVNAEPSEAKGPLGKRYEISIDGKPSDVKEYLLFIKPDRHENT